MVELMVSILIADLAEGKRWAGNSLEQTTRNCIYFLKREERFLWSGRFPYIPSPLHLPFPRRPKPNQAQQQKKIATSMSLLKFTLVLGGHLTAHSGLSSIT